MTQVPFEHRMLLGRIFMPFAVRERAKLVAQKGRLAYYTTAETALKLIQNEEIWMRDSRCMNDFMEVSGGTKIVGSYFENISNSKKFEDAFHKCGHPGILGEAMNAFQSFRDHTESSTYIMSLSAHDEQRENKYGRLSMWRAYGVNSGVAIIFKPLEEEKENSSGLLISPVAYLDSMEEEAELLIENITRNVAILRQFDRRVIYEHITAALLFASVCIKHPGFREEEEWRLLHLPRFLPSNNIVPAIECVRGIPQTVYKCRMPDLVKSGFTEATIDKMITRIIVGPTAFPETVAETLAKALEEKNVTDARSRIVISDIPLRL